jgi:hypothetical protein
MVLSTLGVYSFLFLQEQIKDIIIPLSSPCSSVGCARRWRRPRRTCTDSCASCARRWRRPRSPRTDFCVGHVGISSAAASSWPSSPSPASPAPPVRSPPSLPLPPRPGTLGTCPADGHADTCPLPCLRPYHCSLLLRKCPSLPLPASRAQRPPHSSLFCFE